jgi:hypothetical protein
VTRCSLDEIGPFQFAKRVEHTMKAVLLWSGGATAAPAIPCGGRLGDHQVTIEMAVSSAP